MGNISWVCPVCHEGEVAVEDAIPEGPGPCPDCGATTVPVEF